MKDAKAFLGPRPWGGFAPVPALPEAPALHLGVPGVSRDLVPTAPPFHTSFAETTDSEDPSQPCLSPEPHLTRPVGTACPEDPRPRPGPPRGLCLSSGTSPPGPDSPDLSAAGSQACTVSTQFNTSSVPRGLLSDLKLNRVFGKIKSNNMCKI